MIMLNAEQHNNKIKVGLIINPIAGIGGRVGLKGSDGERIQEEAIKLGAIPQAEARVKIALESLLHLRDSLVFLAYTGAMGGNVLDELGFKAHKIGAPKNDTTTPEDTIKVAKKIQSEGVKLLLFAGGDGTARDIFTAVGEEQIVIGIPAGVKIHSSVFARTPQSAGLLASKFLEGNVDTTSVEEVMDIDENAFRDGEVSARLYGYLTVPEDNAYLQGGKVGNMGDENDLYGIAEDIAEQLEPDALYIIGPGTTTRFIAEHIGIKKTLLGVDVICNKELIAEDVNEQQLLTLIQNKQARIIVTPIGGQGFIFGRGNQQISSEVIRKVGRENIKIVSTMTKLRSLSTNTLYVDTSNAEVDKMLSGYMRVITGYKERVVRKVLAN